MVRVPKKVAAELQDALESGQIQEQAIEALEEMAESMLSLEEALSNHMLAKFGGDALYGEVPRMLTGAVAAVFICRAFEFLEEASTGCPDWLLGRAVAMVQGYNEGKAPEKEKN